MTGWNGWWTQLQSMLPLSRPVIGQLSSKLNFDWLKKTLKKSCKEMRASTSIGHECWGNSFFISFTINIFNHTKSWRSILLIYCLLFKWRYQRCYVSDLQVTSYFFPVTCSVVEVYPDHITWDESRCRPAFKSRTRGPC